jgi:hypothetical protein
MAEFENNPGTAEIVEVGPKLRIHQGGAERANGFRIRFVVVQNDKFTTRLKQLFSLGAGVGAAVDGDNEAWDGFP